MVAAQAPFVARVAAAGFASVFALTLGSSIADAQTTTRQTTTTSTMQQQRMAPAPSGGSSTAGSAQQGSGDQVSRTATGAASGGTSPRPQAGGSQAASPANLGTQPGVTAPTMSRPGEGVYTPQTTPADRIGTGTQRIGPAGSTPATTGSRAQGSGGTVSPTATGPASIGTAPGAAVVGTPSGSVPATAMGASVPGSAAPAPGGNKDAYLTYHRAIESVRLCEGRSFNQEQAEAMSDVIDRTANTRAFGAGNMLMMIRQAREEAFRLVEVEGCQGPKIMAARQLYAKELAPAVATPNRAPAAVR